MTETGCQHCEGHRGIEQCPTHRQDTEVYQGQVWCNDCDSPSPQPQPVGCRCGG